MPSDLTPPRASGGGGVETGMIIQDVRDFDDSGRALVDATTVGHSISLQKYPELKGKVAGNKGRQTTEVLQRTSHDNGVGMNGRAFQRTVNNGGGTYGIYDRYGAVWTENNGTTWNQVTWSGVPWTSITPGCIAWSPVSKEVAVLEVGTGYSNTLHYSTDNGQTWNSQEASATRYGGTNSKILTAVPSYSNFGAGLTPIYIAMHSEGSSGGMAFAYWASRGGDYAEVVAFSHSLTSSQVVDNDTGVYKQAFWIYGNSSNPNINSFVTDVQLAGDGTRIDLAFGGQCLPRGAGRWGASGYMWLWASAIKESGPNQKFVGIKSTGEFHSKLRFSASTPASLGLSGGFQRTMPALTGVQAPWAYGGLVANGNNVAFAGVAANSGTGDWVPFFTQPMASAESGEGYRNFLAGVNNTHAFIYNSDEGKLYKGALADPVEDLGFTIEPDLSGAAYTKLVAGVPAF